jgi:uncharacterized protein (DUF1778 family)
MPAPVRKKEEHLHIRVNARDKKLLAKAAKLAGLSVSAFVISRSLKAAQDIVTPQELRLNNEDRDLILSLLEGKPQKLSPKLAAAFRLLPE